jgi:hypothetical protein
MEKETKMETGIVEKVGAEPCAATPTTIAALEARVAALEARLAPRIKPKVDPTQRKSRRDRVPFGWKVDRRDDKKLVPDWNERETINLVIDANKRKRMGPRAICRYLDARCRKRRGKRWVGAHSLIRTILAREQIEAASKIGKPV